MSALWTLSDMATAMRADKSGALPAGVSGISIDSRTAAKGDAFFAIQGDNRDGHAFVEAALNGGAAVAVVARNVTSKIRAADTPLLEVGDVLGALRDLARTSRARLTSAKVIGVTGSVGKTGTKEALRLALGADGETYASVASYNNHWGVPLSLARCPTNVKYAVFEIGMNHAGEITPLVALVRPHVAIVTTVEPVHLEYFGSLDKIADAKAEIFTGIEPGGAAVLNRDNGQYARLVVAAKAAGVAQIVTFGEDAKADSRVSRFSLQPDSSTVEADILGQHVTYKLGAPGKHLVLNSLAVLTAAVLAGADLALAALALDRLKPATGRGARMTLKTPNGSVLLIDESYNANPASMRAAIALLGQAPIRSAWPPDRRFGRHAGTGRPGCRVAPRFGRADRGRQGRSCVLLRPADARAVGGTSLRPPGRLCRHRGGARAIRARRSSRRRRGDGEGLAGLQDGAYCKSVGTAVSKTART